MTPQTDPSAAGGADFPWQDRRGFLIAITAAAGWLDALAFLYLGKVFVSFMSGNLLFVGIAAGDGDGGLLVRASAVLGAFLLGTAVAARMTGSRLAPGEPSPLRRTLLAEGCILAGFALVWGVFGTPEDHAVQTLALLVIGSTAMGFQAALALAFRLPNVATVAMTATLAQLGALLGWRGREGRAVVARTPAVSLMIPLCLAYLISAVVVALVPQSPAMAFGPVLLLASALGLQGARATRGRSLGAEAVRG